MNSVTKTFFAAALLAVALLAGAARPAAAATPCWKALLNDWYDGRIDQIYASHCYTEAISHLPSDVQTYSSAREDILRALQSAKARARTSGHKVGPNTLIGPRHRRRNDDHHGRNGRWWWRHGYDRRHRDDRNRADQHQREQPEGPGTRRERTEPRQRLVAPRAAPRARRARPAARDRGRRRPRRQASPSPATRPVERPAGAVSRLRQVPSLWFPSSPIGSRAHCG